MRRKERAVTERAEILAVVARCRVCRVGMVDGDRPYVVPLNFGYADDGARLTLFFHGAREGRKIDVLRRQPRVCVEMDTDHAPIAGGDACHHSFAYASVIGFGTARFLEGADAKRAALQRLMEHMTGRDEPFAFDERLLAATALFAVDVDELTGKRRPHPAIPPR